jgi:hypothetical protein
MVQPFLINATKQWLGAVALCHLIRIVNVFPQFSRTVAAAMSIVKSYLFYFCFRVSNKEVTTRRLR